MKVKGRAIIYALLAALLYAVNIPASKQLLQRVSAVYMAGFLYLGAGVGMALLTAAKGGIGQERVTRRELPYTLGMILLDIAAPILLMLGLRQANAANVSLLNNFEIVATTLIALAIFREKVTGVAGMAVVLITIASGLLSFEGTDSLRFSAGSLYVLGASACWGLENNCTRMMSDKSAAEIVILKGIFSGAGSLIVAAISGETFPMWRDILPVMLLGFVSYGLSIYLYVRAQKDLGAARTSACYAVNPFIGSLLGAVLLKERLGRSFLPALLIMILGVALTTADVFRRSHTHAHTHTIVHVHDGSLHRHTVTHTHAHTHAVVPFHWHTHPKQAA